MSSPEERLGTTAFAFVPTDARGQAGEAVAEFLRDRWQALARAVAAPSEDVAEWDGTDEGSDSWYRVIVRHQGPGGSVVAFRVHDAIGIAATSSGDAAALLAVVVDHDPPASAFGEAVVFLERSDDPWATWSRLVESIGPLAEDRRELAGTVEPGVPVIEAETDLRRWIAVLPPERHEQAAVAWLESAGDLCPMGRYLLHASKLRYEFSVYEAEKLRLRASPVEMDEALDELLEVLPTATTDPSAVDPRLDLLIEHVRSRSVAVQVALTRLADLVETVEIAVHNMESQGLVDAGITDGRHESPFARDRALARGLVDQSNRDLAYLRRAAERANAVRDLAAERRGRLAETQARATARLTALQAALVGTLLALFTLNTAFESPVEIRDGLRWPAAASALAVGVVLPYLALRWTEPVGLRDRVAAALLGAATGSVAAAWTRDPSRPVAGLAIVLGAASGTLLMGLRPSNRR